MTPSAFYASIGGLPFIDPTLRPKNLLAAVACSRRNSAPDAHEALVDYLDPANARDIFKSLARCSVEEFDSSPCSTVESAQIQAATSHIVQANPDWQALFAIPIRYRKLPLAMSSSTSALIPQTIYLGSEAFDSHIPLEETLVHEHAHIWLNFVMEHYDLQTEDAPPDFVLPSGTAGKTLRGVLAAAHFAAAALKYYDCLHSPVTARQRQLFLHKYLAGCLDLVRQRPYLTPMGSLVFIALNDFHNDHVLRPEGTTA